MKSSKAVSLVFSIVLSLCLVNTQPIKSQSSGTIYIRPDGSVEGTDKIQRDGNVYTFTGNIYDSIVVEKDNIVVDGAGYTLQGTEVPDSKGVYLSGINNVTIKNMIIEVFRYGILIEDSSNNRLVGNKIMNFILSGIELTESSNSNHISENQIDNNEGSVLSRGILLTSSSKNRIRENSITNNSAGILFQWSSENIISGNKLTNNKVGIELGFLSENNIISGNELTNNGYGIYLRFCMYAKTTISENNVTNNGVGISIDWSSNNLLRNNRMTNNKYNFNVEDGPLSYLINDVDTSNTVDGKPIYYWVNQRGKTVPSDAGYVALVNCTGITVKNLNLSNNGQGILLVHTTNSLITRNRITNNKESVFLSYSSHNAINENNITENDSGIELGENSHNNSIYGNHIEAIFRVGIDFFIASNNSIVGNNIMNNNVGFFFSGSRNNTIYHNNFINNTKQVNDVCYIVRAHMSFSCSPVVNIWDNGVEGNFWSTYYGIDKNGDGIGDTPHAIYEKNWDNYPLMKPVNISTIAIPEFPDTTSPTITFISPRNKTYTASNVSLTFTVNELTSWIGYSLDGQANNTIAGNTTLTGLSLGEHNLIVYARDVAGNIGSSETINFTIAQKEFSPITWIVAAIVIIAIGGAALVVYFRKIRKTREKAE